MVSFGCGPLGMCRSVGGEPVGNVVRACEGSQGVVQGLSAGGRGAVQEDGGAVVQVQMPQLFSDMVGAAGLPILVCGAVGILDDDAQALDAGATGLLGVGGSAGQTGGGGYGAAGQNEVLRGLQSAEEIGANVFGPFTVNQDWKVFQCLPDAFEAAGEAFAADLQRYVGGIGVKVAADEELP
jgi:hypothetical protein